MQVLLLGGKCIVARGRGGMLGVLFEGVAAADEGDLLSVKTVREFECGCDCGGLEWGEGRNRLG
jgi:hypothetical protein